MTPATKQVMEALKPFMAKTKWVVSEPDDVIAHHMPFKVSDFRRAAAAYAALEAELKVKDEQA